MQNTFLAKLYRTDRILFFALVIYMGSVLYYSLRSHEEFPFLLYGMYSLKETPKETYTAYSIEVNGKAVDPAWDPKRELVTSPVIRIAPAIDSGTLSIDEAFAFQKWLLHQFPVVKQLGGNKLDVYRSTCTYDETGQVKTLKKQSVFTYAGE